MLKALADAGHLPKEARKKLSEAYLFLRMIEHRLQMRNDEQTQILPREGADLEDFARWSGFASASAFEKEFAARTSQVRLEAQRAFGGREDATPSAGASFTTKELATKGFRRPAEASRLIAVWIAPPERATARSLKVRDALAALLGDLIEAFAATDDPDAAMAAFDHSFDRMAAPAELFSILAESERLRRLFAAMLGSAPRLAEAIVQRPHLLDVFIDVRALSETQARAANAWGLPGAGAWFLNGSEEAVGRATLDTAEQVISTFRRTAESVTQLQDHVRELLTAQSGAANQQWQKLIERMGVQVAQSLESVRSLVEEQSKRVVE